MQSVNLLMVDGNGNHNKFYRMIDNGNGTWTAEYGRVGANPQIKTYAMYQWRQKYEEKIRKGYVDRSDLCITPVKQQSNSSHKEIEEPSVKRIVDYLMLKAKDSVRQNYTVSSDQVTPAMVQEADRALVRLSRASSIPEFNENLIKLCTIIPRRISNVEGYMAHSSDEMGKIVQRESDLLDVMRGQVISQTAIATPSDEKKEDTTILEALGLKMREVSSNEESIILKSLGNEAHRYTRAWRVTNKKTQKRFNDYIKAHDIKSTKLLWHGSRTENWWSILQTGLVLKPTNAIITGKMFGYGIYYATKAAKSLGYTSLSGSYWAGGRSKTGIMALIDVAYGNPLHVYNYNYRYQQFTAKDMTQYDSLHAHAGASLRNDEIIVYREEQCTIKFLVELH